MNFETVELIKKDKVATIKLNRPDKLNAFNEKLIWELQKATLEVKDDEDIKVLIIWIQPNHIFNYAFQRSYPSNN